MLAMADREELNHLFNYSISDEDLLRAVEQIESTQISSERARTGETHNINGDTTRVESVESYTQHSRLLIRSNI